MRLLYCGSGWLSIVDAISERLGDTAEITVWDRTRDLVEAVADAQVILPSNAGLRADEIAAAKELRLIQQPAAGVDGIDLAAARERGIPVCNAPDANPVAVAEATLLLILALARRVREAKRRFESAQIGGPLGFELSGKTIGLIGMGCTGQALARAAGGLGMKVLGVSSKSSAAEWDVLFAESDVVSLHVPLSAATRGLVDRQAFARMKPGALLINCARGPIVDRAALGEALESGRLGGVGLDTYWSEPWDPADPLFDRDDVIALPHVAGSTVEAFSRITDIVCENVARVSRGDEPLFLVA